MAVHCENCTDLKPELGRLDCKARIRRLEIAQMIRLLSARLLYHVTALGHFPVIVLYPLAMEAPASPVPFLLAEGSG